MESVFSRKFQKASINISPSVLELEAVTKKKLKKSSGKFPKIDFICIDVANGYSEHFVILWKKKVRADFPDKTIIAGNVVTGEMVEELILAGADIIKSRNWPWFCKYYPSKTGVGYPQLSAIIECADAAGLGGHIIGDGGCKVPEM